MGDLESKGFAIEILPQEDKSAFYKHKDGRIVRLPNDPRSLRYYLKKGLTLCTGTPESKGG